MSSYPFGPQPDHPRRRSWAILGPVAGGLIGAGIVLIGLVVAGVFNHNTSSDSDPSAVVDIAKRVSPSIVRISTTGPDGVAGSGSGVIISASGHIVTNHHVIENRDRILAGFSDRTTIEAELLGSDPLTDLAVLSVSRSGLAPIKLGSSRDLVVGEVAVAIGSPLGLAGGPSVTSGVVSAVGRSLAPVTGGQLYGLIQTDAPITRGSSGGALVDSSGNLVGITTAIGFSGFGAESVGFAIPSDQMRRVADDLIETGEVEHAFIGIGTENALVRVEDSFQPQGSRVVAVVDDQSYQQAGGQTEDIIININETRIWSTDQLLAELRLLRAGEHTILTVLREGTLFELPLILGRLPEN